MQNEKGNLKGIIYIASAAICWGVFPALSRYLYMSGSDPISAAVMRCTVCAVIYLIYAVKKRAFKTVTIKEAFYFFVMGLFTVVGMYLFYMLAIEKISSGMAAMLLYTAPAFVIIFDRIFYKEQITKLKLISLAATFIGCALVVKIYDASELTVNAYGIILGLAAGICYSMVTVFGKRMLKVHSADTTAVMPTLFGAVILMCIKPVWTIEISSIWVAAAYIAIGIIGSALPYLLYNKGLNTGLDGGKASLIATVEPVVATLVGVLVFSDAISAVQIVGMALVLSGAILQIRK